MTAVRPLSAQGYVGEVGGGESGRRWRKKGSGSNGIHIFFPLTLANLCMVIYFSFIEIVIYK